MTSPDRRHDIEAAASALAHGQFAPFAALLADDLVWSVIGDTRWSGRFEGKERVFGDLLRPVAAQIDGPFRMHVTRMLFDGEIAVIEGRGDNVLKSGARYDNRYVWMCRLQGGRIRELTEYCDTDLVRRVLAG